MDSQKNDNETKKLDCSKCKKYQSCENLCATIEEYVNEDYVPQRFQVASNIDRYSNENGLYQEEINSDNFTATFIKECCFSPREQQFLECHWREGLSILLSAQKMVVTKGTAQKYHERIKMKVKKYKPRSDLYNEYYKN